MSNTVPIPNGCPDCGASNTFISRAKGTFRCERCGNEWPTRVDISEVASPDAPTVTNERGGSQSHIPVRFDLIDPKALFAMAAVLHEGAEKYGEDNWRLIDIRDHLNHAMMHINAYLAGDTSDDHLSHLLCRATFACGVALTEHEIKEEGILITHAELQARRAQGDQRHYEAIPGKDLWRVRK